jgi:hypothetical protein
LPDVVTIAGNTEHRAAAPSSIQPRRSNHLNSFKLVPSPTLALSSGKPQSEH